MKETKHEGRTVVEHTSPVWRILGVALFFGGLFFAGWVLELVGLAEQFSTIFVITLFFAVTGWARKRPDKLKKRFGTFGKIAVAIQESGDDIRANVYARPMRFLIVLGALYGLVVVVAQSVVVAVLGWFVYWQIAAAAGCVVGALVAEPEFFSRLWGRLSVPDDEEPEDEDEDTEEEDDELARRRAAGEE